jgi:hypothetical protein
MKLRQALMAGLFGLCAAVAQAAIVTPSDAPVVVSQPGDPVAPGGAVSNQFNGFGVNFTGGVAVFDDGLSLAFSGVDGAGIVDLLSPVNAFFTVAGTAFDAVTGFLSVEAGVSAAGNLLLEAFDINGVLIGSVVGDGNDDGDNLGTVMELAVAGIHSFRVSMANNDQFGVYQIEFGDLAPVDPGAVPEPATALLVLLAVAASAGSGRRRSMR